MIDSWAEPEVGRSAPLDHYWYANGACGSKTPFWSLLIALRTKANDSVEVILLGWVDVIHSVGVDVREEKCSFTIGEFMTLIYARLFTWCPRRRSSSINREGSPADVPGTLLLRVTLASLSTIQLPSRHWIDTGSDLICILAGLFLTFYNDYDIQSRASK